MRFDNPILNHKFKRFTDIADYEEVKSEFRNERKEDLKPLRDAFKKKKLDKFNYSLDKIIEKTKKDLPISEKEENISLFFRKKLNQYFNFYKNFKINSRMIKSKIFTDLYSNGFHVCNLDLSKIMNKDIEKKYSILSKKKDWNPPPGTHDRWLELNPKSVSKIDKVFRESGLIKASEAYYAKKMRVTRVRMTVHRPSDKGWKHFFYDCKKVTRHTGIHIDPLEGVTKAMVYLDKVDKTKGPTFYLPKSNRFIYDPLKELFARSIVVSGRCSNKITRRAIFRLPKGIRGTMEFGRFIKDNSEIAKYLDKNLFCFTSDKGNTLLFDPGAGMHNGAVVKNGERIALMVVMDSI
tara:strand:- start:1422 stop:2471 length:1050 start_codon:yes stop_codon:yes gene_type:complete